MKIIDCKSKCVSLFNTIKEKSKQRYFSTWNIYPVHCNNNRSIQLSCSIKYYFYSLYHFSVLFMFSLWYFAHGLKMLVFSIYLYLFLFRTIYLSLYWTLTYLPKFFFNSICYQNSESKNNNHIPYSTTNGSMWLSNWKCSYSSYNKNIHI